MRVTHSFKRLYAPVKEGIYPNAIIAYGKRPFEQFKGYYYDGFQHAYYRCQHTFIIDLWIIALRFDWSDSDAKVEKLRAWEEEKYLASFKARKDSQSD